MRHLALTVFEDFHCADLQLFCFHWRSFFAGDSSEDFSVSFKFWLSCQKQMVNEEQFARFQIISSSSDKGDKFPSLVNYS